MTKYQPGGKKERESILRMIIEPEAKTNETEALEGLKTWQRRLQRAKELKLNIPDASILLASVDKITEKAIKKDPRKMFRLETIREQLKVDIIPTESTVEDLSKFVQAELEEAISAQLDPKVKSISATDPKEKAKDETGWTRKGNSKGKNQRGKDDQKGKDDAKGKGKKGKSEPCKWFSLEEGCKFGQQCRAYHRLLKPEERKCYICGSEKHQASECDRPKRDASKGKKGEKGKTEKGGKGKDDGRTPIVKPVGTTEVGSTETQSQRTLRSEPSDPKEPELEPERLISAFQEMMVKTLKEKTRSKGEDLDGLIGTLKEKINANIKVIKVKKVTDERWGLLDSGATNNVREWSKDDEGEDIVPIQVEVAFEGTVPTELFITKQGTILGPKGTESIVSMNLLVEELGFEISWKEGNLEVKRGNEVLPVELKGGTPSLPNYLCLKLIKEIEDVKKAKQDGRVKALKIQDKEKEKDFRITELWPQLKELLTWLLQKNVVEGMELFKAIICRRRREIEADEIKLKEQIEELLDQVKDRQDQKKKDILIEVCCYEKSKLSQRFKERGGGAIRISYQSMISQKRKPKRQF
jgi:hypothetical protein